MQYGKRKSSHVDNPCMCVDLNFIKYSNVLYRCTVLYISELYQINDKLLTLIFQSVFINGTQRATVIKQEVLIITLLFDSIHLPNKLSVMFGIRMRRSRVPSKQKTFV